MPQWCGLLNIGVGLVKNSGLHWIVTPTGDMGVGTRFHEGGGNHSGFHQVEGSHGSGIHSRSRHKASRSSRNFVSKRVRGCSDWWYKIKPLLAAFLVPGALRPLCYSQPPTPFPGRGLAAHPSSHGFLGTRCCLLWGRYALRAVRLVCHR